MGAIFRLIPPQPPGWKPPIDPEDEIAWPVSALLLRQFDILSHETLMENVAMAEELDWPGLVDRIEISESAGITVEQIDDEITVAIASVVCVHFQVTADQALKLSRALAMAGENAAKFLASTET